jgi:O-antigen ligase
MFQAFASWPSAEATGTYTNRDHFSGLLEMVLPLAILYGLAILRQKRARFESPALPAIAACLVWAVSGLLLLGIIYSLSRMGFLDALFVLFFIGVLSVGPRVPSRKWRWYSFSAVGAIILFMFFFFPPSQLIARFAEISSAGQVSADARLSFWKSTIQLIKANLWFGTGFGGFESPFLKYQTSANGYRVEFAHNDYLQHLAELGVLGFAPTLALIGGVLAETFRGILKLGEDERRLLVIACAGSFLAIAIHSLVDFNLYIPGNAMTLAWIGGIASLNGVD